MPSLLRRTVPLLMPLLLASASLHAQEEPSHREPVLIWVDMTTLWEGVEGIERAGEYTVETMSEIEATVLRPRRRRDRH